MIKPIERMKRWLNSAEQAAAAAAADAPRPVPIIPASDSPWLELLDDAGIPRKLTYPSTTLGRLLDQSADRFPDAGAIIYGESRWTYRELLTRVNRAAGALASIGVRKGDRVLVVLPNCPEFVVTFFAIQKLGAVVVNVGPLMGADDLRTVISMTQPRVAIGLDLNSAALRRASERSMIEHWVWVSLQGYQTMIKRLGYQFKLWHNGNGHASKVEHVMLDDLMARAPARPPTVDPDPSHTAVLQATGGTTGTLKLAELTHRSLLANATQLCTWMGCRPGQDRFLAVVPMFHVYGLTGCLICGIFSTSELVLASRFVPEQTLEMLREHKPTMFPMVPAIAEALCNELEKEDAPEPLEGLRLCLSGAAPLSPATAERFERLTGAKIIEGYGLTEASPCTHANLPGSGRHGSIGLPISDTRIRIVDLDDITREVPAGEPGEMLISGPQIMAGYYANPEQTEIALITDDAGDVWLRTGDIVRCDDEGYFYVIDRRKDMIIRSGLKVYPNKVEKVLMAHLKVADAAVVGRPHPVTTETVVGVLAMAGGMPEDRQALEDELRTYCREHLAPYEVPEIFEFVEALPRSALGKLLRRDLRAAPAASGTNGHAVNGNGHVNGKSKPKLDPITEVK